MYLRCPYYVQLYLQCTFNGYIICDLWYFQFNYQEHKNLQDLTPLNFPSNLALLFWKQRWLRLVLMNPFGCIGHLSCALAFPSLFSIVYSRLSWAERKVFISYPSFSEPATALPISVVPRELWISIEASQSLFSSSNLSRYVPGYTISVTKLFIRLFRRPSTMIPVKRRKGSLLRMREWVFNIPVRSLENGLSSYL